MQANTTRMTQHTTSQHRINTEDIATTIQSRYTNDDDEDHSTSDADYSFHFNVFQFNNAM